MVLEKIGLEKLIKNLFFTSFLALSLFSCNSNSKYSKYLEREKDYYIVRYEKLTSLNYFEIGEGKGVYFTNGPPFSSGIEVSISPIDDSTHISNHLDPNNFIKEVFVVPIENYLGDVLNYIYIFSDKEFVNQPLRVLGTVPKFEEKPLKFSKIGNNIYFSRIDIRYVAGDPTKIIWIFPVNSKINSKTDSKFYDMLEGVIITINGISGSPEINKKIKSKEKKVRFILTKY